VEPRPSIQLPGACLSSPDQAMQALPLGIAAVGAEGFPSGPIPFVSDDHFVYACGNALRFAKVGGEGYSDGVEGFVWGSGNSVSAVAASTAYGVVAYAERRKTIQAPRVFVVRLEDNQVVATLPCESELGIKALDIAREKSRLVILSDVPEHTIMVWDWVEGRVLSSASARASRAISVSWNPLNSNVLVSSGSKLELWELSSSDSGDEDFLMADPVVALENDDREFTAHCWGRRNTQLLCLATTAVNDRH
jgi:hypothetical protein